MAATIRAATSADVGAIFSLMFELAEFEKLTHLFVATAAGVHDALFGARPSAEAMVAQEEDGRIVAYALFFHNFSTFLGRRGLYLEDLYVQPSQRMDGARLESAGHQFLREDGRDRVAGLARRAHHG
jgi:hypothetical protein